MRSFIVSFLFIGCLSFAYTKEDISNANHLAEKGFITQQATTGGYRLDETITRAEVIALSLKIRGTNIPSKYTCKNYFTDVSFDPNNTWICPAIEIAADNRIISKNNKIFRPLDPITKIEALGMIMRAAGLTLKQEGSTSYNSTKMTNDGTAIWQKDLLISAYSKGIIEASKTEDKNGVPFMNFYPNEKAKRYMIFGYIKNTLPLEIEKKYTVTFDAVCNAKPKGLQTASISGKNSILNIYPLPLKQAFSGSYIMKNNIITYIAKKVSENDILLGSYIYQYNCEEKTHKNISPSLNSGLYAGLVLNDTDKRYILTRIYGREYKLPGTSTFYIYNLSEKKGIYINGGSAKGLDKYAKTPATRYLTSIERLRLNKDIVEAKIVINDAGENPDTASIPEYKAISEKWVEIDPATGVLK